MLAVVTLRPGEQGRRHYRLPTERDYEAVRKAQERLAAILGEWEQLKEAGPLPAGRQVCPVPDEPLPPIGTLGFRVQRYGMLRWGDLFTARQKVALVTLARLARERPGADGEAVRAAMAVVVNRCADYNSANCRWVSHGEFIGNTFTRQALPIVWDFVEIDPSAGATGGALGAIEWVTNVVQSWPGSRGGQVQQADATEHPLPDETAQVWFTDPPYYDAVPYADLSDFFLVWLKRALPGHSLLRDPFEP
jgi:adenine-specific DNA methylase